MESPVNIANYSTNMTPTNEQLIAITVTTFSKASFSSFFFSPNNTYQLTNLSNTAEGNCT